MYAAIYVGLLVCGFIFYEFFVNFPPSWAFAVGFLLHSLTSLINATRNNYKALQASKKGLERRNFKNNGR